MTHAQLPPMTPFFNKETMLSILAPEEWTGDLVGDRGFRLFAAPEPRLGYRASMSFERARCQAREVAWLDERASGSDKELRADYQGFELEREDRFHLSCGAAVYARWFGWQAPLPGLRFAQMQALMLDPGRFFYLVNAATLAELAPRMMPVFDAILESIRVIPEAEAPAEAPAV